MYKIAVIGDRDSVYGFAALGLDTYFVRDKGEAVKLIKKLEESCAVIYITEQLAALISDELEKYSERTLPVIIPVPGIYGNIGMGMKRVQESVIRAVGSDIV